MVRAWHKLDRAPFSRNSDENTKFSELAIPLNLMATLVRALQKLIGRASTLPHILVPRKTRFDFSHFAEGDRVYINGKKPKFSKLLQKGGRLDLPDGFIYHDEIIGARPNQSFKTNKGKPYRITLPSLETYISSMPRKVTPVYGSYASYITSLFDIHVTTPTSGGHNQQPVEILDAGTGHGSVTLHLSRAIQAANPPVPDVCWEVPIWSARVSARSETQSPDDGNCSHLWQDWRKSRRAIVHSVEISPIYSKHAEEKVVAGFRRGLYSPHIDFHIANVNDWVEQQLMKRSDMPFLSYVFLDMPSCHRYLEKVAGAMKENALVAVFVPSITQIGDCVREIKANAIPLRLEKALELGDGISNGRLWDVRLAFKKARDPIEDSSTAGTGESEEDQPTEEEAELQSEKTSYVPSNENVEGLPSSAAGRRDEVPDCEPVMVCRPKVGERVIGGGFVGLWRRMTLA